MSWSVEFLSEALLEASEAAAYYEANVPGLGARFIEELKATTSSIAKQPLLWRKRAGGFRRVNLPGFPYYIAYFIRDETILIAAICHASRHPDYWKDRTPS
ncbi:type II toxin-antitoxin system RelE/ParE family toxin [Luteolibacter sp. LG18]|uniref:type II toxin-antitoxin system RelE/ParE family toxin n=1 Tax=Luteolibacter sp. LG18 TaxID=2819286 RepID=UPI002B30A74F|nr:hypothetical protein llg_40290 [Luteolibacter sp. LG18]